MVAIEVMHYMKTKTRGSGGVCDAETGWW